MNHSPLLLNEHPLLILPSLAVKIGLNEAVIFQQVHYWLTHNEKAKSAHHFHDDRWWTYGTYEEWQERDFPFLSVRAVRRAIKNLEERNLLITGQFNRKSSDRTKWYSIDYEALENLESESSGSPCGQFGQPTCPEWPVHESNLADSSISTETINRDSLTRTTTERPKKKKASSGLSEREDASLLEGSIDQESLAVAQWMLTTYPMLEQYGITLTKRMVNSCFDREQIDMTIAVLALFQYEETGKLRDAQRYLEDAIAKTWLPSRYWLENGATVQWSIPREIIDYIDSKRPVEDLASLGVAV